MDVDGLRDGRRRRQRLRLHAGGGDLRRYGHVRARRAERERDAAAAKAARRLDFGRRRGDALERLPHPARRGRGSFRLRASGRDVSGEDAPRPDDRNRRFRLSAARLRRVILRVRQSHSWRAAARGDRKSRNVGERLQRAGATGALLARVWIHGLPRPSLIYNDRPGFGRRRRLHVRSHAGHRHHRHRPRRRRRGGNQRQSKAGAAAAGIQRPHRRDYERAGGDRRIHAHDNPRPGPRLAAGVADCVRSGGHGRNPRARDAIRGMDGRLRLKPDHIQGVSDSREVQILSVHARGEVVRLAGRDGPRRAHGAGAENADDGGFGRHRG